MATRGRKPKTGLAALVAQLEKLDDQRRALIASIRAAADALVSGAPDSGGAGVGNGRTAKGGRRKGFTLSAEARAKIAAAQKKRWAARRKKDSQ
jgi:hypothetical protein